MVDREMWHEKDGFETSDSIGHALDVREKERS
jgi:hypothetical protein